MSAAVPSEQRKAISIDIVCLAAITFASALPYLPHLGLYSDDWGVLTGLESAAQSGSLANYVIEGFPGRPVQGAYLALLYNLFGFDQLGGQIVNTAVIAVSTCLLYLLLVRLRIVRVHAFAAALIFVMLPQLSTARVWFSAFQIPLSMAFALVSIHAQIFYARSMRGWWLGVSLAAAALSVAAYEIFAPMIAGFAAVLALQAWRCRQVESRSKRKRAWFAATGLIGLVAAGVLYKVLVSGRTSAIDEPSRYLLGLHQLIRVDYDWRTDSGLNLFAALNTYFIAPVRGWATGAASVLNGGASAAVVALSIAIAGLAWWRLRPNELDEDHGASLKRLALWGAGAFVLGHATFLLVPAITFTPTGIGTRVQVAAAIGSAMILTVLVGFGARAVSVRARGTVFSLVLSVVTAAAFARLQAIERYWVEAPLLQQRVIEAARTDLQPLAAGSTVLLDGVCPYHGPAIVFETWWDVGPALSRSLGRPIAGDAISSRTSATPTGIRTSIYNEPTLYRYAPDLFVYNPAQRRVTALPDAATAARYFASRTPPGCPVGYVARGVAV